MEKIINTITLGLIWYAAGIHGAVILKEFPNVHNNDETTNRTRYDRFILDQQVLSCAVCAGPAFLCEKLFASTPCPAPDNYCINTVINQKDGTRTVDRKCGDFDTCYREWFQGSSDDDKCRQLDENNEYRLDFQCTYCCITDDCNVPLRPDAASLYKPHASTASISMPTTTTLSSATNTKAAVVTGGQTVHSDPKALPPVTTSCAVCAGPAFLCEKLFAPTPCPAPDNYCINTVINHKDGTRTVDRKCGDFDTCYREWFQGSSDDDKCRQFDENNEQRLDFQCTFCCITDDCNIPLRPDAASLYKPYPSTETTSNLPTSHIALVMPTSYISTSTSISMSRTTTLSSTTNSVASVVTNGQTLPLNLKTLSLDVTTSCAVCAGPDFLCEKLYAPTPCPAPDNYCINNVINHKDGTRTVDRKCGDFDTCYREWFQGSSDDEKCLQFDENNEQRLDFQCTFCCITDDCNIPLRPEAASLYKPYPSTVLPETLPTSHIASVMPTSSISTYLSDTSTSTSTLTSISISTTTLSSATNTITSVVTSGQTVHSGPKTLSPFVTTSCAVCAGPDFLCEKLFASTPCPAPDNYCINTVINHQDGTRTVDRKCGDFDTCYREWFQGSSDDDKCRQFDENNEQRLDFHCTYCCVTDDCNIPLRPDAASLYKPA